MWNFNNGHCLKKLEGSAEAEVTGILAFSEKSVIYTAGWNKCISVYRDDSDVNNFYRLTPFFTEFCSFDIDGFFIARSRSSINYKLNH